MGHNVVNITVDEVKVFKVDKYENETEIFADYFVKSAVNGYHESSKHDHDLHYTINYQFGQKITLKNK